MTGVGVVRMVLQPPPGYPAARSLVVVMAMRPVHPASPMFAPYAELRQLAETRIALSGFSKQHLGDLLLRSKELRHRGVDRIQHNALCFLFERSSGGAVQVDPMKPVLKAPGTKRLKLKYD